MRAFRAVPRTGQQSRSQDKRLVSRPGLFERLSATAPGSVTLVCAPAGSGKTVLLRAWVAERETPVAWTTTDRGERDAQRFWLQLIEALASVAPDEVIERVGPAPSFAGRPVVERLLAQLGDLREPMVLVIDDLHELDSSDALAWLGLLLEQLPPSLRVVLASREEPALGLHRLRLAGGLTELRGTDLGFSLAETRALLAASGTTLSDAGVAKLHRRTEGWVAGLRLAAISLASHPDPERFVSEFSGSERTVAGYLLAEVLERQPPEVRDLLLRTSLLESVTGPLADLLTGGTGAEAALQRLEDQSAFVTALDAGRTRFRYHHLFADLLRLELRRADPASIPSLHRAAAAWLENEGQVIEAVRHYHAAGDLDAAGRLLLDSYLSLVMEGRGQTIHALLQLFPESARREDGNVSCAFAVDSIFFGLLEDAEAYVEVARRRLATQPAERRPLLEVYLAVIALELARRYSDLPEAQQAMRALEATLGAMPETTRLQVSPEYHALALMNLGIVELWSGRYDDARGHLEDAVDRTRRSSRPFIEIGCLAHLAAASLFAGEPLPLGFELSERAVAIAEENGWTSESMTTGAFVMSGLALIWMGRLAEGEHYLKRADETLESATDRGTEAVLDYAHGLVLAGQARFHEALERFSRAQRLERPPAGEHIFARIARGRALQIRVRMGDVESVRRALSDLPPPERDRAEMRIARAALELTQDNPVQAIEALAAVIDGTAPALYERSGQVEALILDATARHRQGDIRGAEDTLEGALEVAEPDGLVLPFLLWPSGELLDRHPRHRTAHGTLITTIHDALAGHAAPVPGRGPQLRDELSDAELRVVRYLPSNLTASEIASELIVSANTVRTHMRHIYAKLDAHTRGEAVARARELGLIGPRAASR